MLDTPICQKTKPKLARMQRRVLISNMAAQGMTTRQMAIALNVARQTVSQYCARHGIALGQRGSTTMRLSVNLAPTRGKEIIRFAELHGFSAGGLLARVAKVIASDPDGFARYMGKEMRPARIARKQNSDC